MINFCGDCDISIIYAENSSFLCSSERVVKILATLSEEQRDGLFSVYIIEVSQSPQKLINFHLDGILEIFLTLEKNEKEILANTIKKIINNLSEAEKRKILIIIQDNAKIHLKF